MDKPLDLNKPLPGRRLEVSYSKKAWSIVKERKVRSVLLPIHQELPKVRSGIGVAGSWFEVVDRARTVIYRRRIELPTSLEVFDEKDFSSRVDLEEDSPAILELLIPDVLEVAELHIYAAPLTSMIRSQPNRGAERLPSVVFQLTNERVIR